MTTAAQNLTALRTRLLAGEGATAAIRAVFGSPVRVRRIPTAPPPPPAAFTPRDVSHRRVIITAADRDISQADLWYDPLCLSPAMNAALAHTDQPFGDVVCSLHPSRRILTISDLTPTDTLAFSVSALLVLPDGQTLGAVFERYFANSAIERLSQPTCGEIRFIPSATANVAF